MPKEELVEHFKQSSALPDDWWLIDENLLRSVICEVLPTHQEEIVDYDSFLKGKTAIAYGLTPNEKRWLARQRIHYARLLKMIGIRTNRCF